MNGDSKLSAESHVSKMKWIIAQILLCLLLGITASAHSDLNAKVSRSTPYWLNYSLIFLNGCQPKVFPQNIIFTEGACRVDAYEGKIFSRGTKVKIDSLVEGNGFTKIRFRYWPEVIESESTYELVVKSESNQTFQKSFELLFSRAKVPAEYRCPAQLKTKRQIIQCLGFPIEVTKEGQVEKYFYILEFVGPNPFSSFDGFWVELKNGKFKDVSGYI